ncbi:MAG: NUDIX domain-containing protein [Verrucomicrobiales bacterium]|nr:NUDIX domain-containing protein [Verrucomicrobiales bacterium]MCP5525633.1 NUDIX domain-containing protein [Verrucomicrobiales bacterium]
MIRNIIFDWSGTLVDDLPAVLVASNAVFRQAGVAEMSLDEFRREFCLPFKRFYDRYVPHVPLEQLEPWFHAAFREAQDQVTALPHARAFLEFCRERRVRTFLLSSVHSLHYDRQAAATGFAEFIDFSYVQVWDKRARIGRLLAEHGLAAHETLFVGDMEHDIETAHFGGVRSCAVLTGYNEVEQLRAAGPDLIVEHLGELQQVLIDGGMSLAEPRSEGKPGAATETPGHDGEPPVPTVGGLIFNAAGRVLLVRTRKWSDLWGIPGGKIKRGETATAALRRELREETGLEIDGIRFVLVQDCIASPEFYRDAHFLLLNYVCRCRQDGPVVLNDEAQAHQWVDLEAATGLPLNTPTRVLIDAVRAAPEFAAPATVR